MVAFGGWEGRDLCGLWPWPFDDGGWRAREIGGGPVVSGPAD